MTDGKYQGKCPRKHGKRHWRAYLLSSVALAAQVLLASGTAQARPDFIEAQMGFETTAQQEGAACQWGKESQRLKVTFQLAWQNFEESLHGGGFNLSESVGSYLIFPVENEGCKYLKGTGRITEATSVEPSVVSLDFGGAQCLEMLERLNVGSIVIHFYEVPSYRDQNSHTHVLRLQIWDHYKPMTCQEVESP